MIKIFPIAVVLLSMQYAALAQPAESLNELNFDQVYDAVADHFGGEKNLASVSDPFEVAEFKSVWNKADKYVDAAIGYLHDTRNSKRRKFMLITAMQNLSVINIELHLQYCRKIIALRVDGFIDDELTAVAIFNNGKIANIENQEIVDLLEDMKRKGILTQDVEYFLSGRGRSAERGVFWPLR